MSSSPDTHLFYSALSRSFMIFFYENVAVFLSILKCLRNLSHITVKVGYIICTVQYMD